MVSVGVSLTRRSNFFLIPFSLSRCPRYRNRYSHVCPHSLKITHTHAHIYLEPHDPWPLTHGRPLPLPPRWQCSDDEGLSMSLSEVCSPSAPCYDVSSHGVFVPKLLTAGRNRLERLTLSSTRTKGKRQHTRIKPHTCRFLVYGPIVQEYTSVFSLHRLLKDSIFSGPKWKNIVLQSNLCI